MKRSELNSMTRRELYEMAKAYDVPGRSRMSKDELVESLSRVSARKIAPKPKQAKRRMAKRRRRRTVVKVRSTRARAQALAHGMPSSARGPVQKAPEAPPAVYIDRGPELPSNYNQNTLQAMVRDPNWLYAYWDLSGGSRKRLSEQVPAGVWVLRVHNVTHAVYDDVPVLLEGGNWYLPVASDTEYRLDIGVLDGQGVFHLAASSKEVRTPRQGISDLVDEEWLILEDEFRMLLDLSGTMASQLSGSRMISEVISGRHRLAGLHSAGVSSFGGSRRT